VGAELLAVPEVVERPRLVAVAAVVVVLLIALPLGAEGGDGWVGGLVVEHAASGRVVRVGEWGERFATGFAFKSGPWGSLLAQAPAYTACVAQSTLAPWPSAPHGRFGRVAGVALATLPCASLGQQLRRRRRGLDEGGQERRLGLLLLLLWKRLLLLWGCSPWLGLELEFALFLRYEEGGEGGRGGGHGAHLLRERR